MRRGDLEDPSGLSQRDADRQSRIEEVPQVLGDQAARRVFMSFAPLTQVVREPYGDKREYQLGFETLTGVFSSALCSHWNPRTSDGSRT